MRILQLYSSSSIGGGSIHVADLTRGLRARGHQTILACRKGTPIAKWLDAEGDVYTLPLRNALDLRSLFRLRDLIRSHEIDIIHAHNGRDYPIAWLASKIAGRGRLIFTRHVQRIPSSLLHHTRMFRAASRIIFVSRAMRNRFMDRFAGPPEKLLVIPNWIDFDALQETVAPLPGIETPHSVGLIGTFMPAKGQREFLQAAQVLLNEREDLSFLLVGDNEHVCPNFRNELLKLAADHPRIHFLPWQHDLRPVLARLTIQAVPSISDGFSIVLLEGMATGRPSIVSRGPGPGELVTHEETGLTVPAGDSPALAKAITRLLDDPELAARLGSKAREAATHYDRAAIIGQLAAMYEEVCSE